MSMSVALMAHPSRQRFIDELAPQLPGVEVVLDRLNDRWDTGRRSLLAHDPAADFHCVVQDDAILCKSFLPTAERAARAAGDRPVGLYVGRVRPHQHTITPAVKQALATRTPWIAGPGPYWGVAVIVPTAHIDELVAWGDRHPRIRNYDRRIEAFYTEQRIDCWYTVPSLVDHRPVAENPSLINGRTGNRQAHAFFGDRSPLRVNWSKSPIRVEADEVAFLHVVTGRRRVAKPGTPRCRSMDLSDHWTREEVRDEPRQAA